MGPSRSDTALNGADPARRRRWKSATLNALTDTSRWLSARYTSPVVLYHATHEVLPDVLRWGVHNVAPDQLARQIQWLQRSLTFLSIDEWFAEGRPRGTACVTFDDGYRSVCELALPRLIDLGVPSTVFVNGAGFRGEAFWRDKVLYLVNNGLAASFVRSEAAGAADLAGTDAERLYWTTKDPARNSRSVDLAIDAFLEERGLTDRLPRETLGAADELVDHPLVTYGNHSYRHYIPSSLTAEQQRHELHENERVLDELGVRRSRVFSIPFGGAEHVDEVTESLVADMRFTAVLYSSNAVNFATPPRDFGGLPTGHRYMAPPGVSDFRFHHARLSFMSPRARLRVAARAARDAMTSAAK